MVGFQIAICCAPYRTLGPEKALAHRSVSSSVMAKTFARWVRLLSSPNYWALIVTYMPAPSVFDGVTRFSWAYGALVSRLPDADQ
jgi:hypothetical protein